MEEQIISAVSSGPVSLLTELGTMGLLAWYMFHNITKTIPGLARENRESVERMHKEHQESNEKICQKFVDELQRERELHQSMFTCRHEGK